MIFLIFSWTLGAPQDADAMITTIDRAEHDRRLIVSSIIAIWLFSAIEIPLT
jgi:hypothetical protein